MGSLASNRRWRERRLSEGGCVYCSRKAIPNEIYCKKHKPNGRSTGIIKGVET